MSRLTAVLIVVCVLTACGAHVYTNTRASGHPHLWSDPPVPAWHPEGRAQSNLL